MSKIDAEKIPQFDSCFASSSVHHAWVYQQEETTWGTETSCAVPPPWKPRISCCLCPEQPHKHPRDSGLISGCWRLFLFFFWRPRFVRFQDKMILPSWKVQFATLWWDLSLASEVRWQEGLLRAPAEQQCFWSLWVWRFGVGRGGESRSSPPCQEAPWGRHSGWWPGPCKGSRERLSHGAKQSLCRYKYNRRNETSCREGVRWPPCAVGDVCWMNQQMCVFPLSLCSGFSCSIKGTMTLF